MPTAHRREVVSGSPVGLPEPTVAKFIQICASRNDLFALDEDGNVYQYNFNAKTWVRLVASRSEAERAGTAPGTHAAEQGDRGSMSGG